MTIESTGGAFAAPEGSALAEPRKIAVGGVVGKAFAVLGRNILPFGTMGLLFWSPALIFGLLAGAPSLVEVIGQAGALIFVVSLLINGLMNGALAYGTFMDLSGQRASFAACIGRGLALVLPVLGVVFLAALATAAGMMLLIIPGFIVAIMLFVAVPVAVVERPGVVASLRRSRELTKGNRWRIFWILIVAQIITQAIVQIGGLLVAGLAPAVTLSVEVTLSSLFGAFAAVIVAVVYYELRSAKEGARVDQLAAVFD